MELQFDNYILSYEDGGIEVRKNGSSLYFNRRPMFVTVKTSFAVSEFYDAAYEKAEMRNGWIVAEGTLRVPSGSGFAFIDTYEAGDAGFELKKTGFCKLLTIL